MYRIRKIKQKTTYNLWSFERLENEDGMFPVSWLFDKSLHITTGVKNQKHVFSYYLDLTWTIKYKLFKW